MSLVNGYTCVQALHVKRDLRKHQDIKRMDYNYNKWIIVIVVTFECCKVVPARPLMPMRVSKYRTSANHQPFAFDRLASTTFISSY